MPTQYPAFLRTYVPLAIAAVVGWLATLGINVSDDAQTALAIGIGGVASAAWYTLIRWAEKRWPWLGALIGSAQTPDGYSKATTDPYATQATPAKDGDEDELDDDLDDTDVDDTTEVDDEDDEDEPELTDDLDDPTQEEAAETDETPVTGTYTPRHSA